MRIEYRIGDLLSAPEKIICHGCNAQGSFKSGVAGYIRERYVEAYHAYMRTYRQQGNSLDQGQVIPVELANGMIIFNAVTQKFYGRNPDTVYADYQAIRTAVRTINEIMSRAVAGDPVMPEVAFPLIGAGLANGDWSVIEGIIEDEATSFKPVVYILRDDLRKFLRKRV